MKAPLVIILLFLCVAATAGQHPIVKAVFVGSKSFTYDGDPIKLRTSDQLTFVFPEMPEENSLFYQLETVNDSFQLKKWPVAVFSSLKPGTYQFNSYIKTPEGCQYAPPIEVLVEGSFMNKWWFIPLILFYLLLLFGGAVYFILLSNFRNKEKLSELRNDWTNKLHTDIGGDLSSVALRLQVLKRKLEPLEPKVKDGVVKTYDILESIQKKLRFVFDLVDPKKDSLQIMLSDVKDYAQENFSLQDIRLDYRNELSKDKPSKLDIGRINKLYMAMKEIIYNSVKSSAATEASILIKPEKEGLFIRIRDNGKGFDTSQPGKGNGLKNLQQFSQEGFLDIHIDSEIGKGTTATILVPDF